jgi:ligand-binding SRPBCC domain-containing protein
VPVAFSCRTLIDAVPETVFAMALSIDAHLGSMAESQEQAVGGVTRGRIGLGESVTWRARHFGVVWTMTSRITDLDEPNSFVDEQVGGPFKKFRHEHRFAPYGSGTEMLDEVAFQAPFGPVGRITERLVLGNYLKSLIEHRNTYLKIAIEHPAV